jgi:hypothetical protein
MLRFLISCFVFLTISVTASAQSKSSIRDAVSFQLTKTSQEGALVHWRITNSLGIAVFVYDFYLWGPPYHVDREQNRIVIETTPIDEEPSCPPNRFPPVLLLVIGPHRTIEGDFTDSTINGIKGKLVSMKIAVGTDPYTVVQEAKQFMSSSCKHNPYDAIVRWGVILQSNEIAIPQ